MSSIQNNIVITPCSRLFLLCSAILGASGVALGAYASHGLQSWASATQVEYFQLAVTYQLLHAITLLVISAFSVFISNRVLLASQICFVLGITFFSGSLYLYVLTGTKMLAMITPIGGLLLIIAWLLFAVSMFRKNGRC